MRITLGAYRSLNSGLFAIIEKEGFLGRVDFCETDIRDCSRPR